MILLSAQAWITFMQILLTILDCTFYDLMVSMSMMAVRLLQLLLYRWNIPKFGSPMYYTIYFSVAVSHIVYFFNLSEPV